MASRYLRRPFMGFNLVTLFHSSSLVLALLAQVPVLSTNGSPAGGSVSKRRGVPHTESYTGEAPFHTAAC